MGSVCYRGHWTEICYLSIWAVLSDVVCYEAAAFLSLQYHTSLQVASFSMLFFRVIFAMLGAVLLGLSVEKWVSVYRTKYVGPRQLYSAGMLYLISMSIMVSMHHSGAFAPQWPTCILLVLCQIYCLTLLYLQMALFQKSALQHELETMNLLWHQQSVQYQLAKENIDIINRKCHDLKHQVAALRKMEQSQRKDKYLREIEESVRIYDAIVKTENETLDTVLSEKSLLCEGNDITISCVADGRSVGFMDPVDLYTMMGNALDNAIEGVKGFQQKELRLIDVLIHVRQRFLVISITNPLQNELTFQEGLPVSSKPKDGYHGYGLRSIRFTAEKYGGTMTVQTTGGCFVLRILIPLPESN